MGVEGAEGGEGSDDMSLVFNKSAKGAALVGARGAQEYDEMEDEYTAMDREQVDKQLLKAIKPYQDAEARLSATGLPDWYIAMEYGFTSRSQMRTYFVTDREVDDVLREMAPHVKYDSPYTPQEIALAKSEA